MKPPKIDPEVQELVHEAKRVASANEPADEQVSALITKLKKHVERFTAETTALQAWTTDRTASGKPLTPKESEQLEMWLQYNSSMGEVQDALRLILVKHG